MVSFQPASSNGETNQGNVRKKKVQIAISDKDDDLYLRPSDFSPRTGKVLTPTSSETRNERCNEEDLSDNVYASHIEMTDPARPVSVDSCNYLNEEDLVMLRNARANIPSLYAPHFLE